MTGNTHSMLEQHEQLDRQDDARERRNLAGYVVRDMLRLADDLVELGLPDSANALRWLGTAVAASTGTEIQR